MEFLLGRPMRNFVASFIKNESGATAVEYGLLATFIALAVIGGLTAVSTSLKGTFNNVANAAR